MSRLQILDRMHKQAGYCSGQRLFGIARCKFLWQGLKEDCELVAREAISSQAERAQYKMPKYLHPIPKGCRPFGEWALDCMTGL